MSTFEDKVNGRGLFIDDVRLPDMQYVAFFRSEYARARVKHVKADFTSRDLQGIAAAAGEGSESDVRTPFREPILAGDVVSYVGQPIAAVVGRTKYEAEDKLSEVEVDYEPLEPLVDPEGAINSEPILPDAESNIIAENYLGKDFNVDASVVVEERLYIPRILTNPIETRGLVAHYDGNNLTVWISTQSVYSIKEAFSRSLSLDPDKIRVIQVDTGGAFGLKGGFYPEYAVVALISMRTGKPMKWIESRSEHIVASRPGRGAIGKIKLYADTRGKVLGLKGDIIVDAGAYDTGMGSFAASYIAYQLSGPYAIDRQYIHAVSVATNKAPLGPYRGAGRPEAAYFMERMMDQLAKRLAIDPIDVRLRNLSSSSFVSPTGLKIDPARPFFERALREMEYERYRGMKPGVSFFVLVPAASGGEGCKITVRDGLVHVWLGGSTHGQRHDLLVSKIVSSELGVDRGSIVYELSDSGELSKGIGAWGSRTAIVGGNAVIQACRKLKDEIVKEKGGYSPSMLTDLNKSVEVFADFRGSLNSFGANLATVQINELSQVDVLDVVCYYDVGRAINESVVREQIEGGTIQGIGQVLSEKLAYGKDGQVLTSSISDAGVLRSTDFRGRITVKIAEFPSDLPHGAKGVGESPTIGVPPAIVSAIENVSGVKILNTPIDPLSLTRRENE